MKISVVIPTRNEERVIAGAILQFVPFFQSYQVEVIISDAWSNDATVSIVNDLIHKYGDHVKLVQKAGKQNIAIGRNAGAAVASGDILFHTDADVRLPDVGMYLREVIEKFANPKIVAATNAIRVYPSEVIWSDRFYHFLMNTSIRLSIPIGWCLAKGECQLVRNTAFKQIKGYDEQLVAGEDCNLFYRLQKVGKVSFLSHVKVYHSPRRFRQYGYWKLSYVYLMEGLYRLLAGRSFSKEWKVVR